MDYNHVRPKAEQPAQSAARNSKQKKSNEESKSKNRDAQKKRSRHKVRGVIYLFTLLLNIFTYLTIHLLVDIAHLFLEMHFQEMDKNF